MQCHIFSCKFVLHNSEWHHDLFRPLLLHLIELVASLDLVSYLSMDAPLIVLMYSPILIFFPVQVVLKDEVLYVFDLCGAVAAKHICPFCLLICFG